MKIEKLKLSEITPYINNAKEHPQEQIDQIKGSIKEFGFNDPTAFYKVHVDDFNKKIYIWNEYYERYKTTDDLKIELESFKGCSIVGDSSAKPTIRSLYNAGYNIQSSIKGKESVVDGIRFLQSYKVVINPECPNLIDEATLYCWEIKDDSSID